MAASLRPRLASPLPRPYPALIERPATPWATLRRDWGSSMQALDRTLSILRPILRSLRQPQAQPSLALDRVRLRQQRIEIVINAQEAPRECVGFA